MREQLQLVLVGVGEVDADAAEVRGVAAMELPSLDGLGFAVAGEGSQDLLAAYLAGESDLRILRGQLEELSQP